MRFEAISSIPRLYPSAVMLVFNLRIKQNFARPLSIIFVSHILYGDFPRVWTSILLRENSRCRSGLIKHRLHSSRL